jgi:hypothetical protein
LQWKGAFPEGFYFSADDVGDDARIHGLIAFFNAVYGAGTPKLDDVVAGLADTPEERKTIADRAFVAALPKRLLAHPKGGALAVIGTVGKSWVGSRGRDDVAADSVLSASPEGRLMEGHRIGAAMEPVRRRYTELASVLAEAIVERLPGGEMPNRTQMIDLYNSRTRIIIGDPAVRLPV